MMQGDFGRDFEQRAIALARAKHDPSRLQGSVMFEGAEHDAAFVDDTSISVYEFTTLRTKEKAAKDGAKIAKLLKFVLDQPQNRYKSATGYFVTQEEPTAEQRHAIQLASKSASLTIHCLSLIALQTSLVDVERYVALRMSAPFGSSGVHLPTAAGDENATYIEPTVHLQPAGTPSGISPILDAIESGSRVIITGDFGIGKSAALRELYARTRRLYFRKPTQRRFPVHINLRDCVGLRTPREIFQRHAEEIGFAGSAGLISAWRAGLADLFLDGFDELVPARWIGSPRDLRSIRWQALDPVRRLIEETPSNASVTICGRPQYFSATSELTSALGMAGSLHFEMCDFDDNQMRKYIGALNPPAWLPSRPLFLSFLAQEPDLVGSGELNSHDRGRGWRRLLRLIAEREASRVSSIPADTFESLISRIAVIARAESDGRGPVTIESMRRVFYDVCGYEAEEEGVQALLRLPGLASSGSAGVDESRTFVDSDFADAAFALELARYIGAPYGDHVMRDRAKWVTSSSELVGEVASEQLSEVGFTPAMAAACVAKRMGENLYDAVLFDVTSVTSHLSPDTPLNPPPFFADILVERLNLSGDSQYLNGSSFSGCVIEVLDVGDAIDTSEFPTFDNCDIGLIEGWQKMPEAFVRHFRRCEIGHYSGAGGTTASILQLELGDAERVALTIFKKVFAQAGSARQVPALSRGLPLELRPLVEDVLDTLVAKGFVEIGDGKGIRVARPVRTRRAEVALILNAPSLIVGMLK